MLKVASRIFKFEFTFTHIEKKWNTEKKRKTKTTAVLDKCTVVICHKNCNLFYNTFQRFLLFVFIQKPSSSPSPLSSSTITSITNIHVHNVLSRSLSDLRILSAVAPHFLRSFVGICFFFLLGWQVGLSFLKYFYGIFFFFFCFFVIVGFLFINLFIYLISFHLVADSSRRNREAINGPVFVIFCLC